MFYNFLPLSYFRQHQKEKGLQSSAPKPSTRLDAKKLEERRERNRLSQRKRRENMSSQKKRREREASLAYYHRNKMSSSAVTATSGPTNASNMLPSSAVSPTRPVPHRSTISRLKKRLGGNLLISLKGLVKSVHKKDRSRLATVGITYQSPTKKAPRPPKLPSPLQKKRDIHTTIVKRLLKKQQTNGLYQRKRKFASLIKNYFVSKANFLPGKSGVSSKSLEVKKVLDKSVSKLHEEFIDTHGPLVSRATFFRHRPKTILSFTKTPFRQCLCEICMNPMLKVKILNTVGWPKIQTLKDLINLTICEGDKKECLHRLCEKCGVHCIDHLLQSVNLGETVSWQKWERIMRCNGLRMDLVRKEGVLSLLVNELKAELLRLPLHYFVNKWQSRQFSDLIGNVPSTWAVVVLDFAENYLCVQQDQPQSAYFGYSQVTVHPCVMYYRCSCGSRITNNWTFISDVLQHSADMVHCITKRIFFHLESLGITKVVVFSDGCASQYKSRLPFSYLQSYASSKVKVHRCFFGARHGKNPCDALGGILKQAATRSVKARKTTIQNAHDLFMFSSKSLSILPSRSQEVCVHMQRAYFQLQAQEISEESLPCQSVRPLTGTRQLHDIMSTKEGLLVRNLSCFCPACCEDDFLSCHNADHVDAWRLCTQFLAAHNKSPLAVVQDDRVISGAPDIMYTNELPAQVEHSRESFFAEVQAIFCACASFEELHVAVKEVSSSLSNFPLPDYHLHTISSIGGAIDFVALSHFSPLGIDHLFPVETVGDGNCVPRTFSFHCFGNQENHVEVRCRIVHEMVSNALDYLCLDANEIAFLFGHSDFQSDSPESVFRLEALNMCRNSVYMGMWQLMAASNALRVNILSVYPNLGPKQYRSFFSRSLKAKDPRCTHAFAIFWSSTSHHESQMPPEYWTANHVVPLMPKDHPTEINIDL